MPTNAVKANMRRACNHPTFLSPVQNRAMPYLDLFQSLAPGHNLLLKCTSEVILDKSKLKSWKASLFFRDFAALFSSSLSWGQYFLPVTWSSPFPSTPLSPTGHQSQPIPSSLKGTTAPVIARNISIPTNEFELILYLFHINYKQYVKASLTAPWGIQMALTVPCG